MKNAILVNIPITETLYPSASLAAIIPVFKKHGIDTVIEDLNLNLSETVDYEMLQEIYHWCELSGDLSSSSKDKLNSWLDHQIKNWNTEDLQYVTVSVFTYHSILFAQMLLLSIQRHLPDVHVIIGGSGVSSNLKDITDNIYFGEQILQNQWADSVIFGDGELVLDALLSGNSYPGLNKNNPIQIDDLDSLAAPDYSDFDFVRYKDNRLLITGSRGCVRHCTFCDIDTIWPKFKYRSPENLVKEIIEHAKKYKIQRFEFTDSLINGSVSGWIKFNELLANAKAKDPDLKDISYSGQFICRDQKNQPTVMYELMHYAGARQIAVGIESFSNKIRDAMKKKFSDSSIEYHLAQCARWSIPNIFLMLVGHPEETIADHQRNVDCLYQFKPYSDMGTIFMIRWGTTMHILKDTPLARDGLYDLEHADYSNSESIYAWVNALNPTNTLSERVRRRLELHCLSHKLGYSQPNSRAELVTMYNILEKYQPQKQKEIFLISK